jgi:hypothetical protein
LTTARAFAGAFETGNNVDRGAALSLRATFFPPGEKKLDGSDCRFAPSTFFPAPAAPAARPPAPAPAAPQDGQRQRRCQLHSGTYSPARIAARRSLASRSITSTRS